MTRTTNTMNPTTEKCETSSVSSRVCEQETKGCVISHTPSPVAEWEKEFDEIFPTNSANREPFTMTEETWDQTGAALKHLIRQIEQQAEARGRKEGVGLEYEDGYDEGYAAAEKMWRSY